MTSHPDLPRLSEEQCARFRDDGFVFVPDLVSRGDIDQVRDELDGLCRLTRDEVILESDGRTVRSVMNPQAFSDPFGRFVRHPALLGPVRQLLERDVYLFQCVINMKRPFHGAVWQWHQDFPTYYHDDAMPEPRLVNALVFIDEVREFNGPLMLIPASHTAPAYETAVDDSTTSYPLRAADDVGRRQTRGRTGDRGAEGRARFGDLRPHQHRARLGAEHVALAAHDGLDHLQRHRQQARPLEAPRLGRAPRLRDS